MYKINLYFWGVCLFEGVNYRHFMLDKKKKPCCDQFKGQCSEHNKAKKRKRDLEIENQRYVEVQQRS